MAASQTAPLNDEIIVALGQLVDDAQTGRRDPSHSDIEHLILRHSLRAGDPNSNGQTVGKMKRIRAVLSWALEGAPDAGGSFAISFVSLVRGHGGFRVGSPNYVGADALGNCIAAFASEGFVLGVDGDLRAKVLDALTGMALTDALMTYVRRAKKGAEDAALEVGTGKDLVEAVAAHVLQQKFGAYSPQANFPTLLGQAFVALNLSTPQSPVLAGEPAQRRVERAMYELACAVNQLRNKQGTGHGRPWLPTLTDAEARSAIESMGLVAEFLLLRM
ncbi:abortive infection family protein [Rhizobacter sp. OV335]|uniref:abortive infection family protein n=1 Tax=Rhizobacter sp. OV335 TaxID=1500264 RepID=UPI000921E38F|nr:abortive infection family protein [Rhizobacter sp. OV335]SHN30711.1 Abortive infection C-terminus [Rhizobacter sp. OV335]